MTEQFIGMKISLTSRAQLRYRGTVHSIDSNQGTMTLQNVTSMGTEDRPAVQFIPPMLDRVHPVVVFTVNDILDLAIEPSAPPAAQALPDDPAIRQSSQLASAQVPPAAVSPGPQYPQSVTQQQQQQPYSQPAPSAQRQGPPPVPQQSAFSPPPPVAYAQPPLSTLEKIEQTVGEIRRTSSHDQAGPSQPRSNGFALRGGRGRGGFQQPGGRLGGGPGPAPPVIPAEEYDFEQMNRRFEEMRTREQKPAGQGQPEVVLSSSKAGGPDASSTDDSEEDEEEVVMSKKGSTLAPKDDSEDTAPVYNKSKSFFDSVSSDVSLNPRQGGGGRGRGGFGGFDNGGRGGGGGGGGGGFKWQRSQERMTNLNTFGEAGGNNNYHPGGGRGRGGFPRGRGRGGGYRGPAPGYNAQQQQQLGA